MRIGTTFWRQPPDTFTDARRGVYPYTERYVRALRSQVEAAGFELTLLSNQPFSLQPGDRLLINDRAYGWWSKLEWFAPWNRDLRPCAVFDLDTFIFDPGPILELEPDRLWLIREFLDVTGRGESGIFIAPKDCDPIWEAFEEINFADYYGDGAFLRQFPHQFIPDEVDGILSYKGHRLQAARPNDARVVCFHGRPRPHEAGGWASQWFDLHTAEK